LERQITMKNKVTASEETRLHVKAGQHYISDGHKN
jgi:hypothetical protein